MAAQWAAVNAYSVREMGTISDMLAPRSDQPGAADRGEVLGHIRRGNQFYNARRYRQAADAYLTARALLLKFVWFDIDIVSAVRSEFVAPLDEALFNPMLEAATEHVRIGLAPAPQSPFVKPRFNTVPDAMLSRLGEATLPQAGPKIESAVEVQEVAKAYLRIGDAERADAILGEAGERPLIAANPEAVAAIDLSRAAIAHRRDRNDAVRTFVDRARANLERSGNTAALGEMAAVEHVLGLRAAVEEDRPVGEGAIDIAVGRAEVGTAFARLSTEASATRRALAGTRLDGAALLADRSAAEAVTAQPQEVVSGIRTIAEQKDANRLAVLSGDVRLDFALGEQASTQRIVETLYEPRTVADTLARLKIRPEIIGNFTAFVPHHYYYVIPVALGDCYHQLGHYEQALQQFAGAAGYRYLNQPIEAPKLWIKMARSCLAWGDALYRRDDRAGARAAYERVLAGGAPAAGSALYEGGLAGMAAVVQDAIDRRAALVAADPRTAADLPVNPWVAAIVTDVLQRLAQLDAGLNALGFADDYVPSVRFEYLQGVARSFAQFAAQANREYVGFRKRAEEESFTMLKLEQAADLARKGLEVERARVMAARRDEEAALAAEEVAQLGAELAQNDLDTFQQLGWENVVIEEALAWSTAATQAKGDEILQRISGLESITAYHRRQPRSSLIKFLTRERARRSFEMERGRMENRVAELQASAEVAARQRKAAAARTRVAELGADGARMRYLQSLAEIEFVRSQEIDADLYNQLADLVRETARQYLDRAVEVAFLMERAYEFEHGMEIDRIRLDYGDLDVADGLYAADQLLQDIDFFTHHKILSAGGKPQPAARAISLATEHPLEFLALRRTGTMRFSTRLQDFIDNHPGIFNGRIKQIELLVEGLVGPTGPVGSLSCGGVSRFRRKDGTLVEKVHGPETMLLSDFRPRRDALVADVPSEILRVFENVGLETDWILSFPKDRNDFDFQSITDVRLIVSYLAEHDPTLEAIDRAAQPAEPTGQIWYSLRFDMAPDAFFLLADSGSLDFAITPDLLPHAHVDPATTAVALIGLRADGTPQPLVLGFRSDAAGAEADRFASGPTGVVTVLAPGANGGLVGTPVAAGWHLRIDPAENQDLAPAPGAGGTLDLTRLQDLILVIQYRYARG